VAAMMQNVQEWLCTKALFRKKHGTARDQELQFAGLLHSCRSPPVADVLLGDAALHPHA